MEVHPACVTSLPSLLPESTHKATVSHQTSQQVSPSSSDLNSLFESGDAALEAFQGDATARLVLRPIAPSQKTSGAGTSPTSSYEPPPPSSTAAQWQNYSQYNGEKDVQMAFQLQQEKEHRQAAEERANQAIELARQLAMTLAAQQGLDTNGIMPSQQSPAQQQGGNMMPSQPPSGSGLLPQQSHAGQGANLLPQQASLTPLSVSHAGHCVPLRPSFSYNDFTPQGTPHYSHSMQQHSHSSGGQQHGMDSATAAARYILTQNARSSDPELHHQLLPQQQQRPGDWPMAGSHASHDGSPWGTPHAGGPSTIDELTRQLNLIQLQQQHHQAHMAQLSDGGMGALNLSQQLHHHHPHHPHHQAAWGAAAGGFRDTFKPASWSRTQRDKVGRFAGKEPRQRRSSADSDALSIRDTLVRSAYGLMPLQPAPRVVDMRRVFVGNIGWWVDDALLAEYFGRFGTITDMQVMWNTRQLSKGKKINREFAFISYGTPEEAQRAIGIMHGKCIEGLAKDSDGLTVQYEAIGSSRKKKNLG